MPQPNKEDKERVKRFYRARIAAVQATFEGYVTVQRAKLDSPDCQLTEKKRAALLKKLAKEEATMEKAFRRAIKEMER